MSEPSTEMLPGYYAVHQDCEYGPGNHRYGPYQTEAAAQRFIDESALLGWAVEWSDD